MGPPWVRVPSMSSILRWHAMGVSLRLFMPSDRSEWRASRRRALEVHDGGTVARTAVMWSCRVRPREPSRALPHSKWTDMVCLSASFAPRWGAWLASAGRVPPCSLRQRGGLSAIRFVLAFRGWLPEALQTFRSTRTACTWERCLSSMTGGSWALRLSDPACAGVGLHVVGCPSGVVRCHTSLGIYACPFGVGLVLVYKGVDLLFSLLASQRCLFPSHPTTGSRRCSSPTTRRLAR